VLLAPVVFSINQAYNFSEPYYYTVQTDENVPTMLAALETPDLQWVQPPFGEHFWIQPAMEMNLKLSPGIIPWQLKDRKTPGPYLEAIRSNEPTTPGAQLVNTILGVNYFVAESNRYATIVAGDQTIPCFAQGSGGSIEVTCDSPVGGTLVVKENVLPGWKAWVDEVETSLSGDNWLEVDALAGTHTYKFRYLPWNVPLGLLLFVVAIGLSIWLWFKPTNETASLEIQSDDTNIQRDNP
jgi:hypothetical protein